MIRSRVQGVGPGYRHLGDASAATAGISAGVGLATAAVNDWLNSIQLSHDADSATTEIVNGLASQLSNLDAAYLAQQNPSCADQRAALDSYDEAWQWLQSPTACGNPNYGAAGNRCISDRAPGGKYPWATYYRTPIASDPRLATSGCDTSQEVLLPSLSTGAYSATGVTAAGNLEGNSPSTTTGITNTSMPAISPVTTTAAAALQSGPAITISPTSIYVGLGILGAILLLR